MKSTEKKNDVLPFQGVDAKLTIVGESLFAKLSSKMGV